ncbi:MAG: sel1 repeat family protein [Hyphomicrobiales bacterium]
MYVTGVGISRDSRNANTWFEKSFIQFEKAGLLGDGYASRKIAERYQWGLTVERNVKKAVMWFEKAGEQGDVRAMVGLGTLYLYGLGLPHDHNKAYKLYKKAAEQGNTKAQFVMGNRYYQGRFIFRGYRDGRDIIQDYEKAYKWYMKAAEQGSASAHKYLAAMHKKGLGVAQNYRIALTHYYLSRYLGNKSTQFLPKLKLMESILTDVEIDKAKQHADIWVEAHKQVSLLKARCRKIDTLMNDAIKNGFGQAVPTHNEYGVEIGCGWE